MWLSFSVRWYGSRKLFEFRDMLLCPRTRSLSDAKLPGSTGLSGTLDCAFGRAGVTVTIPNCCTGCCGRCAEPLSLCCALAWARLLCMLGDDIATFSEQLVSI